MPAAPCYCCCCCSFLGLVALLVVGLLVTGALCADVRLSADEMALCDPLRPLFGSVLVTAAASFGGVSATSYLLAGPAPLSAQNTSERRTHQSAVAVGANDVVTWTLVEGSRVDLRVVTERAGPGIGAVASGLYLLDYDNFLLWRNGRGFELLPGSPPQEDCGPVFNASIDVAPGRSGPYYAVLCNRDVVALSAAWNVSLFRTRWNVSDAKAMCAMATCNFAVGADDVVVTVGHALRETDATVAVYMKQLFSTNFRASVFATVGVLLLIVCIVTCAIGLCSLRRKQLPPPLLPHMPVTQPLLPSPPDTPPPSSSSPSSLLPGFQQGSIQRQQSF